MNTARLRIAVGIAILAALVLFAAILVPVYWRSYQFQQSLENIVAKSASDDAMRAAAVESAARLRLPVRAEQVRFVHSGGHVQLEVRYAVPVDLSLYTVDLHFRSKARR